SRQMKTKSPQTAELSAHSGRTPCVMWLMKKGLLKKAIPTGSGYAISGEIWRLGCCRSPLQRRGLAGFGPRKHTYSNSKITERSFSGYRIYGSQMPLSTLNLVVLKQSFKIKVCNI
ncbi:MAG TPA: hypothetical protein VK468_01880, partial [Pyrinomonadaceae bacterium]|nr:hypothetical protein [Pyrinomonadaceae bacterium]